MRIHDYYSRGFSLLESLTLFLKGLKITFYVLAGRYFGSDGFFQESIFQVDRRTVSQPYHTSPCSSGTLSLTGARYLNRTIPPRAVQGTCHLIPLYSIVKGLVKYRTLLIGAY